MRLLVTGATGFIGRHVVHAAVMRGHEVHAVARRRPDRETAGVRYHAADLLDDRPAVARLLESVRPTHLLHLAWYAEPGLYWTSPLNFRWVAASLELALAFAAAGGTRIVAAGSCAEYDWASSPLREQSTPLRPVTAYGTCKNSLRTMLECWSAGNSMSVAWPRIFFTYGPWEPPERLVSSVVRGLLLGKETPCSEGSQRRDFLYVEDLAAALVKLTESELRGPVNIGSGAAVAVRDIADQIAVEIGQPGLLAFGAAPVREEPPVIEADVTRLRDELGWQPSYDIRAGIRRTVEWWRDHLH